MNQFTNNEQTNSQESFESLCKNFQNRFEAVTSSTINPSTITTFYEDALYRLISLTDDVVRTYTDVTNSKLQGKELEDEAMTYYGLTSINEILTIIEERITYLLELQNNLSKATDLSPEVFVPPNPQEKYLVTGSCEGLEVKQLIPRLLTLGYILEHDLGLTVSDPEQVIFLQGEVTDEMMRKHPYIRVSINPLNRIVYLCDEEENASFIFDKEKILEKVGKVELLDVMEKFRYKEMIAHDPECGDVLRYGSQWRNNMNSLLAKPFGISQKKISEQQENSKINVGTRSDFMKMVPKKREGWENANFLQSKIVASPSKIDEYAQTFKLEHPEWFEDQKPPKGVNTEYYHPDLVAKILEKFGLKKVYPKKKTGWESSGSLCKLIIPGSKKIDEFAQTFKSEHPEWFEEQKSGKHVNEHYHPDLVAKIFEIYPPAASYPNKKNGWESASSLTSVVVAQYEKIKEDVEFFRIEHPEWFEVQRPSKGKPVEHYHPDLVDNIIKLRHYPLIGDYPRKKVGWENSNSLLKKVIAGPGKIDEFAQTFKKEHPDWFQDQRSSAYVVEHYHPDLVAKILEKFDLKKVYPKKKTGWESANSLKSEIVGDREIIKHYVKDFRNEHPEWFEKQRSGIHLVEHYHPDLVAKIVEHFPKKEN